MSRPAGMAFRNPEPAGSPRPYAPQRGALGRVATMSGHSPRALALGDPVVPQAQPADWRDRAACQGKDLYLFFGAAWGGAGKGRRTDLIRLHDSEGDPEETRLSYQRRVAMAKAICADCPVRPDCLAYALEAGEKYGIWGGLTERERREGLQFRRSKRRNGNTDKTHCKHGHLLDGDNVYVSADGKRKCRACARERQRKYREVSA